MFFIFKPKDFIEIKDSSKAKNKKKREKSQQTPSYFGYSFKLFRHRLQIREFCAYSVKQLLVSMLVCVAVHPL